MNNIAKKIITLSVVLALAVAAVLAFYHTIVAPPTEVLLVNSHKVKMEERISEFSTSETEGFNDTLYNIVVDQIALYNDEGFVSESERNELIGKFIRQYTPTFVEYSMNKFYHSSIWRSKDHKAMEARIKALKKFDSKLDNSVLQEFQSQIETINDIIHNYRQALSLSSKTSFVSVVDANKKITAAKRYMEKYPLNNCTSLYNKLALLPLKIGKSHYNKVESQVKSMSRYRQMTWNSFSSLCNEVNRLIGEYSDNVNNYGNSAPSADVLQSRASGIYREAYDYYTGNSNSSYTW